MEMFPPDRAQSSRTIFINPNFAKVPPAHINPNFLRAQLNPSIHVNPNFLAKNLVQNPDFPMIPVPIMQCPEPLQQGNATVVAPTVSAELPIISKSRTKIVRVPMRAPVPVPVPIAPSAVVPPPVVDPPGALIKIGLRKLIRTTVSEKQEGLSVLNNSRAKYKVDRRPLTESNPIRTRKTSFTGRYALRRGSESLPKRTISRFIKRNPETTATFKSTSIASKNKQLQLLNINGVLYKSTRNKLERNDVSKVPQTSSLPKKAAGERAIIVRGTKYLLDKSGFNLTPVASTSKQTGSRKSLRRIDIGGLTYVAKSKNVLVRTDTHLTRNHVSSARQKSINLLSKRFVKTNIPCPIFQRVGKCAAFERGKCMKVHDKMHVAICRRFLRGECHNASCLLSHSMSLSKMPVCKFFLQGCCVREDCPYLHKKLSDKAEICADFLKGFCRLAQECNKRHEFLCPDMETKGKCEKVKCPFCRKQRAPRPLPLPKTKTKEEKKPKIVDRAPSPTVDEAPVVTRYFVTDSKELGEKDTVSESNINQSDVESDGNDAEEVEAEAISVPPIRRRPQLGELPAFIPFS